MALILFLTSFLSFAHVIQDDVFTTRKERFAFKTVCSAMVAHEAPLIDVLSSSELDCMGKKISIRTFCEKKMAEDPYYLRAYIDQENKEVVCHSGKTVVLKYLCARTRDKKYCDLTAKSSCEQMQELLAKRLDMVHSSFTKNEKGIKQLNCYFGAQSLKGLESGTL